MSEIADQAWFVARMIVVPVALAVLYLRAQQLGRRRYQAWKAVEREPGDLRAGPARLDVSVVGETDEWVLLGTSDDGESPSSAPLLTTATFGLQAPDGNRFDVPADRKLRIERLPGARRRMAEAFTTDSGLSRTYTFEVQAGCRFWMVGTLPEPDEQGPFRGAHATTLDPLGDEYRVDANAIADSATPGCAWAFLVVLGALGIVWQRAGEGVLRSTMGAIHWTVLAVLAVGVWAQWDDGKGLPPGGSVRR